MAIHDAKAYETKRRAGVLSMVDGIWTSSTRLGDSRPETAGSAAHPVIHWLWLSR